MPKPATPAYGAAPGSGTAVPASTDPGVPGAVALTGTLPGEGQPWPRRCLARGWQRRSRLARARRGINIPLRSIPAELMPMEAVSLPAAAPSSPCHRLHCHPCCKAPCFPAGWLSHPRCGAEGSHGALVGQEPCFGGAMGAACNVGCSAGPAPGGFLHPQGISVAALG